MTQNYRQRRILSVSISRIIEYRVLLAKHEDTGDLCALKIMDKTPEYEEAMTSIVLNEIKIMTSISHKNIVNLLSYSLSD